MNNFFDCIKKNFKRHLPIICCTFVGCFAGIWGLFCGLASGFLLEKIILRFLYEYNLHKAFENGHFENIKGEAFPGSLYVSALAVFCLNDVDNAVHQMQVVFGKDYDWYASCRVARSSEGLNSDLLVEYLASSLKKSNEEKSFLLQNIFRLLGSVEFLWDEKTRGQKPSVYLAELLNYSFNNDELANAYRVLGLAPGADIKKVRSAHRKLAAKYHPDLQSNSDDETNLSSFVRIQTAYETILHQLS